MHEKYVRFNIIASFLSTDDSIHITCTCEISASFAKLLQIFYFAQTFIVYSLAHPPYPSPSSLPVCNILKPPLSLFRGPKNNRSKIQEERK